MIKTALVLAGAVLLGASANAATTITASIVGPDAGPLPGQTIITNFDTAAGLTGGNLIAGSTANSAAPFGDTTQYLSVAGGTSATLTLANAARSLSFYWGSIDTYNTVQFFAGDTLVGSFIGSDVPQAPATGAQQAPSDNRRVNFAFSGAKVTSVVFSSSSDAFELDSVAGVVPEPATWAMLIVGMGMVGAAMRRRQRLQTVTA